MRRNVFTLIFCLCSTALSYAQEPPVNVPVIGWLSPARIMSRVVLPTLFGPTSAILLSF